MCVARYMSKAFDAAWPLKKSDFAIGGKISGRRAREDPFGIHYDGDAPVYNYRTPIGKDEDGNLIYSEIGGEGRRVESKDFAFPAQIYRYKTKRLARLDPRMEGLGFDDEDYQKTLEDVMDDISAREIMDTLVHESGHSAHEKVDHIATLPGFWRRNKNPLTQEEMGGEDSFNRRKFAGSLAENIAYTTEYPFDGVKRLSGIFNHPDVKDSYENKILSAGLDIADNKNIQQRRNLINAVLDITSQAGRRGLTGNYGYGDIGSVSNKLKQARRTSKKIIDRIKKLPDDVLQGGRFTDLPPEVQEQLGRLMLQEQLSLHNELNFERQSNERFDQGDEGKSLINFMRADPDKFFDEYVQGDPGPNNDYYEWGKYDLRIDPKKARGMLPNYPDKHHGTEYWEGLSPEEIERLQENFTERDGGRYIKPRVQSNPYTATPKVYSNPRFGTDFVNELIESAYNTRHYNKEYMDNADSSRVFMKAWDLLKMPYYHGTSTKYEDEIRERGLDPSESMSSLEQASLEEDLHDWLERHGLEYEDFDPDVGWMWFAQDDPSATATYAQAANNFAGSRRFAPIIYEVGDDLKNQLVPDLRLSGGFRGSYRTRDKVSPTRLKEYFRFRPMESGEDYDDYSKAFRQAIKERMGGEQ